MTKAEEFKKVGEKLKEEVKADKEGVKEDARAEEIMTALTVGNDMKSITENEKLTKMYNDSASVGASNLASQTPLLKVHSVGKSTTNELADGSEPNDGWFFYKPTGEQFETVSCHILSISRGFRSEGVSIDEATGKKKSVFNQIISGVITNDGELKPFMMYITGLKLSYMWEFSKVISKFTKMRPVSIPMFALSVTLTSEQIKNSYGKSWIINFDYVKNKDKSPVVVGDQGEFQYLKDSVGLVEETINSLIASKTAKANGYEPTLAKEVVREADSELDEPPF